MTGIIAIGASTGGTVAIRRLLRALPQSSATVLIAQHIPESFSSAFARRLNASSALEVRRAVNGEALEQGTAYVAPGDQHLTLRKHNERMVCQLSREPCDTLHHPSVDVLFESVRRHFGANATGVLLTGMGSDGARGLLALRQAGARTICQDEATSVVWGMPGTAVSMGAAKMVLPLHRIAQALIDAPVWAPEPSRQRHELARSSISPVRGR